MAHPITQHLLMNFVFADVTGWRTGGLFYKIGYVTYQAIIFPFMALMYFFCPCFPVARKVKRPFIKFINHTASFVIFLILLAASSEAKLHIRFRHWPSAIEWITLALGTRTCLRTRSSRFGERGLSATSPLVGIGWT